MVASVSALSSASQAASYYEADDYYAEGGMAPSQWFGEAAEKLGLSGEVDREKFAEMLEGRVAGQQLGTTRDGKVEHRPGWDITLSAPKSVSIMAEVAGDKRLIKAHGAAVKVALAHVEKHMAATRIRQGGEVLREATGNLAIATFRHATSRAQDPQLHTHGVILNATQDKDGNWRSLEPRAFYQLQKEIGAIYRQELAHGVTELGYRIEAGKDSLFEIAGVPEKAIDALSQRTAAIDARLAERGTSRAEASAAEKQIAALDTREAKSHADHRTLRADWRATADGAGFDKEARDKLISEASGLPGSMTGRGRRWGWPALPLQPKASGRCPRRINRECANWLRRSTPSRRITILMENVISGRSIRMTKVAGRPRDRRGLQKPCSGRSTHTTAICSSAAKTRLIRRSPGAFSP